MAIGAKKYLKIYLKYYYSKYVPARMKKLFHQARDFAGSRRPPASGAVSSTKVKRGARPVVLFSSCVDEKQTGDIVYNGGVKIYNLWVKLLRSKGVESYIVTYDGKYKPWMIEHQPHVSIETVRRWKREGKTMLFVTCWVVSKAFNDIADELYLHDCEPGYTFDYHFPALRYLLKKKICGISTETRAEQAFYQAVLARDTKLISPYCDPDHWHPDPAKRETGLVGYLEESADTGEMVGKIATFCKERGVKVKFHKIAGSEMEIIDGMQKSDIYIGLNPGKDEWDNEGLARTHLEAMSAGCVVTAYDVGGNREFIINGFSGFLVMEKRWRLVAEKICELMENSELKERIRFNSMELSRAGFSIERCWPDLKDFLGLEEMPALKKGDNLDTEKQEHNLVA